MRASNSVRALLCMLFASIAGCSGGDLPGPSAGGELLITTRNAGATTDPDGYTVTVDAQRPRAIGTAAAIRFGGLAAGAHRVQVGGIASNCVLEGGVERIVEVAANATTGVELRVTCGPPTGKIEVRIAGGRPDRGSYSIRLDGGPPVPAPASEPVLLDQVADGVHVLAVSGFALGCGVAGGPQREVTIHGQTVEVTFEVTCLASLGGRLLFNTSRGGADPGHLASIRADGSDAVDLGAAGEAGRGQWSPDGTRIAFESCRDGVRGDGYCEIYMMNADGSRVIRITNSGGFNPTWSPDGRRIVFAANGGLHLMNADGTDLTRLTVGRDESPDWSPDGSRIAFSRLLDYSNARCMLIRFDPACPNDIMTVQVDGTGLFAVTHNTPQLHDYQPAWSPDGSRIAFVRSGVGFPAALFLVRADGTGAAAVAVDGDIRPGGPVWSPDGTAIAISAEGADGATDIGIVPAAGGAPALLTRPGTEYPSDWR